MNDPQKLPEMNISILLKQFISGVIVGEIGLLIITIYEILFQLSLATSQIAGFLVITAIYLEIAILLILFNEEKIRKKIQIWHKSWRGDLLIMFIGGLLLATSVFNDFSTHLFKQWILIIIGFQPLPPPLFHFGEYQQAQEMVSKSWLKLTTIAVLPAVIPIVWIAKFIINVKKGTEKKHNNPLFISDEPINGEDGNKDEFEFEKKAGNFAENVFNNGSPNSMVFGIDAPWGMGKSSFVNLCKKYWDNKYKGKLLIYEFNPLEYENKESLMGKFIDGLIKTIKKELFVPEIESLISHYATFLQDSKPSFSFLGFTMNLPFGKKSQSDIVDELKENLRHLDKKIVIIIDDLDRLHFSEIKEILFTIKKAFTFPNVTYILCYDTENIAALERNSSTSAQTTHENKATHENLQITLKKQVKDSEKIAEFLEKFVNVKISLFIDNNALLKYFTSYKNTVKTNTGNENKELTSMLNKTVEDIFKSKDYHQYLPFIGNPRKIKRILNSIKVLGINDKAIEYDQLDFNGEALINLLLIYINYPNIFRKIYNTETQGKKGFFSLVDKFDDYYPVNTNQQATSNDQTYKNSTIFEEYLSSLNDNQKFILRKLFSADENLKDANKKNMMGYDIPEEMRASSPMFNGSQWMNAGNNLEEYLRLIIGGFIPEKTNQRKFYQKNKEEILKSKRIEEILGNNEFSFSRRESNHEQLWRVLVNSAREEFTPEKAHEIIRYALHNIPQYSLLYIESIQVGFRELLPLFIVKLLDQVGWADASKKHWNNSPEHIAEIAQWIFGERPHEKEGVLDTLNENKRGVLGLHDVLAFRLRCCSDRGGEFFNVSNALIKHADPNAITTGNIKKLVKEEMREMSQRVFAIFKGQYIDQKKNIFEEIDKLTLEEACGKFYPFITSKIGAAELDNRLLKLKSELKFIIIHQLTNTRLNFGIGCGYYDESDSKDQQGIHKAMNAYLFEHCFNPDKGENNYHHFVDFLLLNLEQDRPGPGVIEYKVNKDKILELLDPNQLISYWKKHGATIKGKKFEGEVKIVYAPTYDAPYATHIKEIYEALDALVTDQPPQSSIRPYHQ